MIIGLLWIFFFFVVVFFFFFNVPLVDVVPVVDVGAVAAVVEELLLLPLLLEKFNILF